MPRIIIDGRPIDCREDISVLQAALDAGGDVPHYCYHPGLSIVASCRLCLMEMKVPNPRTQEPDWSPKLLPACQTPVRDGMEVRFHSERVRENQRSCMEFFLLNHPLDCPVCDQSGECWLQDYSFKFGRAESRMIDEKCKNPKKDVGPHTLLYQDRCVMCTRCVRFTQEISGTSELCVVNRGSRCEIDAFPGKPLANPLQGNVVDLCPVGALLDKQFLFRQRVWLLTSTPSICAGCATGCAIWVDHNQGTLWRLRPRYNPGVNDWWMCDDGRFGWRYVHDGKRIAAPRVRRGSEQTTPDWAAVPQLVRFRIEEHVRRHGGATLAAVLSPFMTCEEAWLLIRVLRDKAPASTLVLGPVPTAGETRHFPVGATGNTVKFTIQAEKCPNRRGIELLLAAAGGNVLTFEQFAEQAGKGEFKGAWIVGGYPQPWVDKATAKLAAQFELLIVQDIFENDLLPGAAIVLPACAWAEREGCFVNARGLIQPFQRALNPPAGAQRDGQYLYEIAGFQGLYSGVRVRAMMAEKIPAFAQLHEPPPMPRHAH
ncbi:MAG TPA: 2Fe-2S iron-sulfur cluster-binding protein [Phycisphaerae bacterium]|nr:2Fe-2S iron-sulfur cluster-binding protein [Phycisphaerae bacterium]HNU44921.1 2Fe-2S iron-sulfur cluster-binding protein [Phycisphaerae bacterium]